MVSNVQREYRKGFAKRLREQREKTEMTQRAFAEFIGLNVTQYSSYECGHATPSLPVLVDIVRALGLSGDLHKLVMGK